MGVRRGLGPVLAVLGLLQGVVTVAAAEPVWPVADIKTAPQDGAGALIRQGAALVENTFRYIGPEAKDPANRVAGNNLACTNCHLRNGTAKLGLPLAGAAEPLDAKINNCLVTNMNGRPLAADAPELAAIVAYIRFLGSQMSPAQAAEGRGLPLAVAAGIPAEGRKVFAEVCMMCHGGNGLGKRLGPIGDGQGYNVPPVWGRDSFTSASGLMQLPVLANFIHANMPDGATWDQPLLSPEDAINAAAFILTAPRPHRE